MTELITTQPAGVAAILAALGFLLTSAGRFVASWSDLLRPVFDAIVDALKAWTRRTIEERDCAPKLTAMAKLVEGLRTRIVELERAIEAAGHGDLTTHIVETRDDEPTGDQRLPKGVQPRRRDTR